MSPDTAGSGEHHLTVPTLVHPASLVGPQVGVEAAPADEGLAALVTDKGSLASVGPGVLLQVGGFLENLQTTILEFVPTQLPVPMFVQRTTTKGLRWSKD